MRRTTARTLGIGLVGGIAGLVAMRYTMKATRRFVQPRHPLAPRDEPSMSLIGNHHERGEPATEALARTVYTSVSGRSPSLRGKAVLGQAVHFGFGLTMATLYGAMRKRWQDGSDLLNGALFGAALWLVGDELLVPLLGLADKPTQYSVSSHVHALAGHLAYGAAAGTVVGALHKANGDATQPARKRAPTKTKAILRPSVIRPAR